MSDPAQDALRALDVLAGRWALTADFTGHPAVADPDAGEVAGTAKFEWILGGRFLAERSEVAIPEAPDGFALIGPREEGDGYVQHYFDSRGVARVYDMTLEDRVWTLSRTKPDFTPLKFAQRFVGEISPDGQVIEGRWETANPGEEFRLDFGLDYARVA